MTLGKFVVGVWIPLSEIRLHRVSALSRSNVNAHHSLSGGEGIASAKVAVTGEKSVSWVVTWPSKSSVAPGIMLGAAMVARGEIGYLLYS